MRHFTSVLVARKCVSIARLAGFDAHGCGNHRATTPARTTWGNRVGSASAVVTIVAACDQTYTGPVRHSLYRTATETAAISRIDSKQ